MTHRLLPTVCEGVCSHGQGTQVSAVAMPDFLKPFVVETDTSHYWLGLVCYKRNTPWSPSLFIAKFLEFELVASPFMRKN